MFDKPRAGPAKAEHGAPVECLGLTFEDEDARRAHFLAELKAALEELHAGLGGAPFAGVDDAIARMTALERWPMGDEARLRALAERMAFADPSKDLLQRWKDEVGFPHGEIDDILNLSDPPYYTSCPNPFIGTYILQHQNSRRSSEGRYNRVPFAADVNEGKHDPIYLAHSYHTKVPHKAIMRYILHYTDPGDIIFDGFCGTGMTGVAAQMCGDISSIESLGYRVDSKENIIEVVDSNGNIEHRQFSKLGIRRAILSDLSPSATFIAYNYNTPTDVEKFEARANQIIDDVESRYGWMYETNHKDGKYAGHVISVVWSNVYSCPECTSQFAFWQIAVDHLSGRVHDRFSCQNCGVSLSRKIINAVLIAEYDELIGEVVRKIKQVPVLITYRFDGRKYEKHPDSDDADLLEEIRAQFFKSDWFPSNRLFYGGETRRNDRIGITHIHHFYTERNLQILAGLRSRASDPATLFLFNSQLSNISKLNRYRPNVSFPYNPLSGTLYVGSQISEANPFVAYRNKIRRISAAYDKIRRRNFLECNSLTACSLPDDSVDYIFTDPPFGSNLSYSELNIIAEEWLRIRTNWANEAIENRHLGKSLRDYQILMENCFQQCFRILRPGRWITVVFHNSKNSVWNAIQQSLHTAQFIVADVRILDKGLGTFKQVTSTGAVKRDLVISAYKPNDGLEERFALERGTEDGAWDFVRTHLGQLPIFVRKGGDAEIVAERQPHLLFDRMVAFHVLRNVTVPLSVGEFLAGVAQRFPERDGMVFLPEQVAEYDRKRAAVEGVAQLEIFVTDEESAIQWLKRQLDRKPQSFQDIHPQFLPEIAGGQQKHEKLPELSAMLEQNFLRYDGAGDVPSQIHAYLSSNFKDLRNLPKDHPALRAKAQDRWYVPDPNKAADMEKRRARALLREFEEYRRSPQKRLKLFRTEAMRAGFLQAWRDRDYATIVAVAEKIPETVLQEDRKLLLWYDQALTRAGADA